MSNAAFFAPTDLLGLAGAWVVQSVTSNTTTDRESGLDSKGNEVAYHEHNAKKTVAVTYMCFGVSGGLSLPAAGSIQSGYHVDRVNLSYTPTGWPTMTVAAHAHGGAAHSACNQYAASATLPAQFGVPSSAGGASLGGASATTRALSYTLTCIHLDELGGDGDWGAAENHDGVETLDIELIGDVSGALSATGWTVASDNYSKSNTSINSRAISLVRHLGLQGS